MIGRVLPRGTNLAGLLYYLFGPGKASEHLSPHLVAGWRHPAELEPARGPGGRRDFRMLTGLMEAPLAVLGDRAPARPVWHCVVRAAPGDPDLGDGAWMRIAAEVMHRTGLSRQGEEDQAVPWVAVHHGDNHIHIVAMLARQDLRRAQLHNDYYRIGEALRDLEAEYGLVTVARADRTAARGPTRAEIEKAARNGQAEPLRVTLRRHVAAAAAGARSEPEFFAALARRGVQVRLRHSEHTPGQVTGYAVTMPGARTAADGPVWFGGGKLAPDLTLPKLRHRWNGQTAGPAGRAAGPLTPAERAAIWDHVTRTAAGATEQIRQLSVTDPGRAADAAWAAADTFHAAASALGSRALRQAADCYARAARAPYGRVPYRTRAGDGLRGAARLLALAAPAAGDPVLTQIALIVRLIALAQAVADLRVAQRHAAQAAAARAAAGRLHAARCAYGLRPARQRAQERAQAPHAGEDFPFSIRDVVAREATTAHTRAPASSRRASPAAATPRQRGPTQ